MEPSGHLSALSLRFIWTASRKLRIGLGEVHVLLVGRRCGA